MLDQEDEAAVPTVIDKGKSYRGRRSTVRKLIPESQAGGKADVLLAEEDPPIQPSQCQSTMHTGEANSRNARRYGTANTAYTRSIFRCC